jgi:hypothetical protein
MVRRPKAKTVNLVLRLPPELHEKMVAMAAEDHRSLNAEIVMHLLAAAHEDESRKRILKGTRYTQEELKEMENQIRMLRDADRRMRKKLGWPKKK